MVNLPAAEVSDKSGSSLMADMDRHSARTMTSSHCSTASVLEELINDRGVSQCGDVAQILLIAGDFTKNASHNFPYRNRRGQG